MVRGLLLWAAGNHRLERTITENPILSRATHRFIAGERLEEALEAAAQLNARGIGGILDLLGEGVTDLEGANKAVEQYVEAAEAIAARSLDATISIKLSQLAQTVDRSDGAGRPRTTPIHPFLPPHRMTDEFCGGQRFTSWNLAIPPTEDGHGWTRRARTAMVG